ncbi:MAG: UDP-glucose:glycoprotein glucosyltransferase-domain-containing protein [Olpidium bornovanus]|uniref:UDP-glucose:glycoprotein glucosyltransferase-domain-containing protein n=1 Tax=Olpidium bornovanus TaxID=278681 RepID=A0A8H7ZSD2_9FUNG|nr:MAG: UDP-glucose:glycoprotein glucosyltransferase-domain-containing protein [Olpidium bornovanus]
MPIKRFYRYVLSPELRADNKTGRLLPPLAEFQNVPTDPLLTLGTDVIGPWVVSAVESGHDLDNIRLRSADSKRGVEAVMELENILVEGHARDMTTGGPPRGLQFVLSTRNPPESLSEHHLVDTIVMANLGYFQLKGNPGLWTLGLREGRSAELFNVESVGTQGWHSGDVGEIGTSVVVRSFGGVVIFPRVRSERRFSDPSLVFFFYVVLFGTARLILGTPRQVRRKPGKESEDVLVEPDAEQGVWSKIKSA